MSYRWWDRAVALHFHDHTLWERFFETVTFFGRAELYLVAAAVLFLFYRKRREAAAQRMLFLFSAVAVSGIVVDIVKVAAGRFRPNRLWNEGLYGFDGWHFHHDFISFPSGHSAAAFAGMTALALMWPRYRVLFLAAAALIAFSRVALASHFISDVLVGSLLGWGIACLLYRRVFKTRTAGRF